MTKNAKKTCHPAIGKMIIGIIKVNYYETAVALHLNNDQLMQLAINAFEASWLADEEKGNHISQVRMYFDSLQSK